MSRFGKMLRGICGKSAADCKAEDCPDHGMSKAVKELISKPLAYGNCAEVFDVPCPQCQNPSPHDMTDDLLSQCRKCGFQWL